MRVLATSDLHGNLEGLNFNGVGLALIAGDVAPLSGFSKWCLYEQKKWLDEKFFKLVEEHPEVEFVFIPGNHDKCLDPNATISYVGFDWRLHLPKNAHLLINQGIDLLRLKIYGTPNVPIISHSWAFETEHEDLIRRFSKIPENLDILISHTPPHIGHECGIDCSLQFGGTNAYGSRELADAIFEKKPRYVFCGHIHTGSHECVEFGESRLYNVSRLDENYSITYDPIYLEI